MSLKQSIQSNKAVLKFLLVFFGTYVILTLGYQAFLKYVTFEGYFPDIITHNVAYQSWCILDFLGYDTEIFKHSQTPSMSISINGKSIARVIEGCNSISIIILFISFVFAFHRGLKPTLLFMCFGAFIIYIFNLLRIALLVLGLYFYSNYGDFLHDILFPLFLYGVVLILWLIWIKKYKTNKQK